MSSIHRFSNLNSNYKILEYYHSINNNYISSSSLSLSSISSNQSIITKIRNKRINSLSSLSTTSINIILHALHPRNKEHRRKKFFNKNHSRYENSHSSSSILLPRLTNKNKTKQSLNQPILSERNRLNIKSKHEQQQLFISSPSVRYDQENYKKILSHEEKLTLFSSQNSLSNSISNLNNLILSEIDKNCNQSTQTDNYLSIREQYQYGNLRRVNSDLLDYIFIPISK